MLMMWYITNHTLKNCWGIVESKGHDQIFKVSNRTVVGAMCRQGESPAFDENLTKIMILGRKG